MEQSYRVKRILKGIKIKDIAKYIGCSNSTICRYEREDNYQISLEKVQMYKHYIDQN